MSYKQLSLVLKIGQFIGHTPSLTQIEKSTGIWRIYHIVLFALVTFGHVKALTTIRFYTNFNYIKMMIGFLSDVTIHSFNFYSMVVVNLFKKQSWERLVNSLNSTSHLIQFNPKSTVLSNFIVIFLNLLHLATSGSVLYILCKNHDTEFYLARNLITHVQVYLKFFHKLMFYLIVNMILARYREA
jgi:hypothetical protein